MIGDDEEGAVEYLKTLGWTLVPPQPAPVEDPLRCSVCGTAEEETEFGHLTPIQVLVSSGEEGHSDVTRLYCDDHLARACWALISLGFESHLHGGTSSLAREDGPCGGYDACKYVDQKSDARYKLRETGEVW